MLAFVEDRQFLEGREHGVTMVLEYKDVKPRWDIDHLVIVQLEVELRTQCTYTSNRWKISNFTTSSKPMS